MGLRRISIHADVGGTWQGHDVAVCARTPVAALLPVLVDVIDGRADAGTHWQLRTTVGEPLDESRSLSENDVHDGDVVVLGVVHDAAGGVLAVQPVRAVADADGWSPIAGVRLLEFCWAAVMVAIAATLMWTGTVAAAVVATWCAVVTAGRAVVVHSTALAVTASLVAGAAGFIAVPAGPGVPNVLLSAAVVFAVTVTLGRLLTSAMAALVAVGSAAALTATVAAVCATGSFGTVIAGAALTVAGFAQLTLAPRLAAAFARVQPGHLADPPRDLPLRAGVAHRALTGLVGGAAIAAAAGSVVVASAERTGASIAFVVVTALLLLTRVRTHVDAPRRIALAATGIVSTATALTVVAGTFPDVIGWVSVGLTAGLGTAVLLVNRSGPTALRAVDALDYLCAALLVPLACWVIGLYAVARNWVFG